MLSRPSASEDALRLCHYGTHKRTVDCLVYSPHGHCSEGSIRQLWDAECESATGLSFDKIEQYCRHEADLGANEIAEALCQRLAEQRPECHIALLRFERPRGLLDINRYPQAATPAFFQQLPAHKQQAALELHARAMQRVMMLMRQTHTAVHVHTMASHDGIPEHALTTEDIQRGIRDHYPGFHCGDARPYNIFLKNENGRQISHLGSSHALLQSLQARGIEADFDRPYQPHSHYPGTEQMGLVPSIAVDIPKSMLATADTAQLYNPGLVQIAPEQIRTHAELLARAIGEHLIP